MSNYKLDRFDLIPPCQEDWNLIDKNLDSRKRFLEIGASEGRSIIKTAESLMREKTEIICNDNWLKLSKGEANFDHNLSILKETYPTQSFIKVKKHSTLLLAEMMTANIMFDFIYIDSRKYGISIIEDFAMSFLVLNPNGIIMIDDYNYNQEQDPLGDSKWATNMLLFQYQKYIKVLHKGDRCIIKKLDSDKDSLELIDSDLRRNNSGSKK